MKRIPIYLPTLVILLATTLAGGCKGRTLDNVEPDGETVEVTPGDPHGTDFTEPTDTITGTYL